MKKEISLNRYFMIFLAHSVFSLVCTGILWAGILYAASLLNIIIPANTVERSVSAWRATLDGHSAIRPEDIPSGADYAFFNKDGMILQSTLDKDGLKTAGRLASSTEKDYIRRAGTDIFLRIDTDTQCLVVSYRLIARFASPVLQRIFPNAELSFLILLLFLLIADIIFISLKYARRLNRELQKLADAARRVGEQTLDFNVQRTGLLEFNRILDSLEHLKTDLQSSLTEQWAMEQQKKQQLTALAHDIKTPLTIVRGNAELLLETGLTEEQHEYAAFILEHSGQIQRYVTGMMEISKPVNISGDVCELRKLLDIMAENIESLGKRKHLSCRLLTRNLPDSLSVPKEEFQRILDNLTDNAVQYSPEGGTVFLYAELSEEHLLFRIRDEGKGFSGEALSLAATEFYRSDQSRGSREHFGLGLSIVKQIATALGGTLTLENAPEGGALVTVCFPLDMSS